MSVPRQEFHLFQVVGESVLEEVTVQLQVEGRVVLNQGKGVGKSVVSRGNSRCQGLKAGEELKETQALGLQFISYPPVSCNMSLPPALLWVQDL